MARKPARKAHPFAVDVGAGILEERERFGVVAKIDPDLFQDRVRVLLDQSQPLFGQQPDRGDVARDVAELLDPAAGPLRVPRGAPAAAATASFRHGLPPSEAGPIRGNLSLFGLSRTLGPTVGARAAPH